MRVPSSSTKVARRGVELWLSNALFTCLLGFEGELAF